MKKVTTTELVRNMRQMLNHLSEGEEVVIERHHQPIARLQSAPVRQTALEAMADLYRTLTPKAARGWEKAARGVRGQSGSVKQLRNPWGCLSLLVDLNSGYP